MNEYGTLSSSSPASARLSASTTLMLFKLLQFLDILQFHLISLECHSLPPGFIVDMFFISWILGNSNICNLFIYPSIIK